MRIIPRTSNGGKGTLKANTFTCDGKVFIGWATSAEGDVVYADLHL